MVVVGCGGLTWFSWVMWFWLVLGFDVYGFLGGVIVLIWALLIALDLLVGYCCLPGWGCDRFGFFLGFDLVLGFVGGRPA